MRDVQLVRLAGRQFNRVSRRQLLKLGFSPSAIAHRLAMGRLEAVEEGVFAIPPVLDDDRWGAWMAAALTDRQSFLSQVSAATAWGFWSRPREFETVTRPGSGGRRRHGGVLVFRSETLAGETTELNGVPITTAARTLVDLSATVSDRALARAVREAIRLGRTDLVELGSALGRHRGRRGVARLALTLARYSGLPLERARSGAEVRALEILRDARRPLPRLNVRIAGAEADLSWPAERLVVEIDGAPFHLDAGEDARKESAWRAAGWNIRRIPADDVYDDPQQLLKIAPNVPE